MSKAPLQPVTVLRGHEAHVQSVCFHPTETKLYSGDSDGIVRVWDTDSTRSQAFQVHSRDAGVLQLAYLPAISSKGSPTLVTQGRDGSVMRWDMDRGFGSNACKSQKSTACDPIMSLSTRSYHFCRMAVTNSPSPAFPYQAVALAGEDPASPTVWDLDTGSKTMHLPKTTYGMVMSLSFPSPSLPLLMIGCDITIRSVIYILGKPGYVSPYKWFASMFHYVCTFSLAADCLQCSPQQRGSL